LETGEHALGVGEYQPIVHVHVNEYEVGAFPEYVQGIIVDAIHKVERKEFFF
jgi:hypothetical protein